MPDSGNIRVDVRLDSYKVFYDYEWTKQIIWSTQKASVLNRLVFDLDLAWLATAQAANLPWVINAALNQMSEEFLRTNEHKDRYAGMLGRCMQEIDQHPKFNKRKRTDFINTIRDVLKSIEKAKLSEQKLPFEPDYYWQSLLKRDEEVNAFKLSLWASQSQAFASLYFAYEHFQDECLFIAGNVSEDDRRKYNQHPKKKALAEKCVNLHFAVEFFGDPKLNIIREVRNAIAHRGGKQDHRLKDEDGKKKYDYHVEEGTDKIQIEATNVSDLYRFLKDKVWKMCAELKTRPEFK